MPSAVFKLSRPIGFARGVAERGVEGGGAQLTPASAGRLMKIKSKGEFIFYLHIERGEASVTIKVEYISVKYSVYWHKCRRTRKKLLNFI